MLERSGSGWKLTIQGDTGTNTVFGISGNGTMWDESGAPVNKADVKIAMISLDETMKARVWSWWQRQPQARD